MNYDSNSNINAFVSNNTNKRSLAVKSFKMTGCTPPLPPLSITIQNVNNINLGASSGIENRSIQNVNNINLGASSGIQSRSIQNDNNVDLGVSSVIQNRSIQNVNNINLGTSSVITSRSIQNDNNVDLGISSVIQNRSIQNDNNINLGVSSVIQSRSIQNDNNINLGVSSVIQSRSIQNDNNVDLGTPVPLSFWLQIGQDIYGENAQDRSGYSVSISDDGTIVAIGAILNDDGGSAAGQVRVYENVNDIWVQIGQDIDGDVSQDLSGWSVSLNSTGNIVAIGAILNDGNGNSAGQVRVYQYNGTNSWIQIGQDIYGENAQDQLGSSVSLNSTGDIIAIGAAAAGLVRIYQLTTNIWTKIGADIVDPDQTTVGGNSFGFSVGLNSNGTIVVIGAPATGAGTVNHGRVVVYKNVSGTWTQIGQEIDGVNIRDYLGNSVSISDDGNIIAMGASTDQINLQLPGYTRVYGNVSDTWIQIGQDIVGENNGDQSGTVVSLNSTGNIVAISADRNGDAGTLAGQVRVYQNVNGIWTKIGAGINGEAQDQSGNGMSISSDGTIVAIGAIYANNAGVQATGRVRVYRNL
jgi:hypothetical protein